VRFELFVCLIGGEKKVWFFEIIFLLFLLQGRKCVEPFSTDHGFSVIVIFHTPGYLILNYIL